MRVLTTDKVQGWEIKSHLRAESNRRIFFFFFNNNKILLITNISNYISFPPQIAYKLIEAGISKDSLQIQGLSIDGLNNREYTTIQYRD